MKTFLKVTFVFASIALILTGCDKNYESNLQGEWSLKSKPLETSEYYWYFNNGQVTVTTLTDGDSIRDTCSTGSYILKNGVLTIAAEIGYCKNSTYAGDWEIQKLTADQMTLLNTDANGQGGSLWYEFAKN